MSCWKNLSKLLTCKVSGTNLFKKKYVIELRVLDYEMCNRSLLNYK